jgi:hypothetical protein
MSYLAMSAALIDNENNQMTQYETPINKKRQNHNKTQKFRQSSSDFDPQKVNSVLQSIHNSNPDDDSDLGNYNSKGSSVSAKHSDDFKPLNPFDFPAKPLSVGSERTKKQEGMTTMEDNLVPKPTDDEDLNLQELQSAFMNDAQVREYYRKLVPSSNSNSKKNENNKQYYASDTNTTPSSASNDSNQVLVEKLNYMINLLEEQQDQKTNSVTEEVVLYSFLGVFIIFVVDSFARVGKYVR